MASADRVLAEFIAAGQVWYIAGPDQRPALLTDVGPSESGQDGVCLFPGRQEALAFLRASDVPPGQFRPRRGVPHPRRPRGVGAFVRACRRYSDYLCLPWPASDGLRFEVYVLEIKQLLQAARQARPERSDDAPRGENVWRYVFDHQRFPFSDN